MLVLQLLRREEQTLLVWRQWKFHGLVTTVRPPPDVPAAAQLSPQRLRTLHAHVKATCEAEGNTNRFLATRLVGGGRCHFASCWHIDPDIREACFRDTVRVPATPAANGPLRGVIRLPPLAELGVQAL